MKGNQSHLISSWRPIAVLDTSYRLFACILNKRILNWVIQGKLLSPNQEALLSSNGCGEHNAYLITLKERSIHCKESLQLCWLDLADAFGSIPHELLWCTLLKMGCCNTTIELPQKLYIDAYSSYTC